MSKLTKFISIAHDMVIGNKTSSDANVNNSEFDMERFCDILQWLEEFCRHQEICEIERQQQEVTGTVRVLTKNETQKGVPAQVKIFLLQKNMTVTDITREVNFIRDITDWDGKLERKLPVGEYKLEISKGSEYEINYIEIKIKPNQITEIENELVPILHLDQEGWISGDLHHHSIYSSPVYGGTDPVVESPATVCRSMVASGVSYGALSDHHNILNHKEWRALKSNSFTPIISKEISTSNGHVMALGVTEDMVYQIPDNDHRTDEYLRSEFIRITKKIKELGGLPQLNHPRDSSRSISWNENYMDIIQIFETIEIWNGSNPMLPGTTNYKAFKLWLKLLEEGRYIPATTGSDTHNILANDYHAYFNKFNWYEKLMESGLLSIPDSLSGELQLVLQDYHKILPLLKKWAETNLTSAGVRTYVNITGEATQEKILNSLKQGRSFLTNGPILIPEMEGKLPGDTLNTLSDKISIHIKLIANRPLKQLFLYTNGASVRTYELKQYEKNAGSGRYDYSHIMKDIDISAVRWMFFIAQDDCTNMAITNPIFINCNTSEITDKARND